MHGIYCEAFGFLIAGHTPENRTAPEAGTPETVDLRCPRDRAPRTSENSSLVEPLAMPSRNLLKDIDQLCIRNLIAAIARGEPLESQLVAAIATYEENYGERPTLPERPAREVAA